MALSVLIPDGEHDTSFKVMTCLAQVPKIRIHVLSNEKITRTRYSRFCASFHFRESGREDDWFEQIRIIAEKEAADVILPGSEAGTRFACAWRERLSEFMTLPPLPSLHFFDTAVDKGSLADFMRDRDLPTPRTVPAAQALDDPAITFPVLIKPRRSYSGIGIEAFHQRHELERFIHARRAALDSYIVQEFVVGGDVGCNVLCRGGEIVVYTVQRPMIPHPRPFAFSMCIRFVDCAETLRTVQRLMYALEWNGVANIDLKYSEARRRYEILDVNPRYWGTLIGSLTAGVNFPYLACLQGLNLPLPEPAYRLQSCYMEVGNAVKSLLGKVKGNGGVVPNFVRETNLPFILRDPVPFLNRSIERRAARP